MGLPEKLAPRHSIMARSTDLYDGSFNDQEVLPRSLPLPSSVLTGVSSPAPKIKWQTKSKHKQSNPLTPPKAPSMQTETEQPRSPPKIPPLPVVHPPPFNPSQAMSPIRSATQQLPPLPLTTPQYPPHKATVRLLEQPLRHQEEHQVTPPHTTMNYVWRIFPPLNMLLPRPFASPLFRPYRRLLRQIWAKIGRDGCTHRYWSWGQAH